MGWVPSRHGESLAFVALYAILYAAWSLSGGAFHVWPDLWQLLPWPPLLEDLPGALLDLHSQPPFLNLLFGLALKASAATGVSVEAFLAPVWFAAGAGAVAAMAALARDLVFRPWMRRAVLLLFVANPYLQASVHYVFYTPWELLFLLGSALLAFRFLAAPSTARLAAAVAPALLLVHARSLFHPLWLALLVTLLVVLARPPLPRRASLAVAGVTLLLVAAWPLKNLARFGFLGFSSWSGLSIARGVPTGEPLLPSGYPARLGAFARASGEPPDPRAVAAAQRLVPPEFRGRPALAAVTKPDGSPNWNHYAMIPLSRELGEAALRQYREDPSLLLLKAADFYLNGYALYEGRWPYQTGFSTEMTTLLPWARAYELLVFQPFRDYDPARTRATTGFALAFPLVMIATLVVLWRRRRSWSAADRTVVVMLLSIAWVLALILFVDGPEGNRVRFSTEPFLFLTVGWLLGGRSAAPGQAGGAPRAAAGPGSSGSPGREPPPG